MDDKAEYIYM